MLRIGIAVAVVIGLIAAAALAVPRLFGEGAPESDPAPAQADSEVLVPTLVFATFDERDPAAGTSVLFALGVDDDERATLLLIPSSTIADIPGHGVERVGRAFSYGRGPLVGATIDNLLGVAFGATVSISEQGWASIVNRVGGLTVDLPERLVARDPDGSGQVRFAAGEQHLDGVRVAELLGFRVTGETELNHLARVRRVFDSLLASLAEDPGRLDDVFADGAPMIDTAVPLEHVRRLVERAAAAKAAGELDMLILPVSPLAAGDGASYRLDRERADALVAERFPDAVPADATMASRRLQILNGNGTPGIGQEIAERVLPAGFRVVLTDNADHFRHDTTRVIVHSDHDAQIDAARELVRLIGVGTVEISRTPQSVVDFTIVVGHDFLEVVDR
jgi:polyisoprenyl-teichoic acid--peptidoglycan teichoic acid transferase